MDAESPPALRLQTFLRDKRDGPELGQPVFIDWDAPWSSPWNKEVLSVLTAEYLHAIRAGEYPNIPTVPDQTEEELVKICSQKLDRVRTRRKKSCRMTTDALEELDQATGKAARVVQRRHTVFLYIIALLCRLKRVSTQLYRSRKDAISKYLDNNPELWAAIAKISLRLGPDGVSSDETDNGIGMKTTKRVRKAWLSQDISDIWRVVEAYHQERTEGENRRGNKQLSRNPVSSRQSFHMLVKGLPRNYYDDIWYQSRTPAEMKALRAQPPEALPDVAWYVSISR